MDEAPPLPVGPCAPTPQDLRYHQRADPAIHPTLGPHTSFPGPLGPPQAWDWPSGTNHCWVTINLPRHPPQFGPPTWAIADIIPPGRGAPGV